MFFEDRTPAHADHVGFGLDRQTTAACGEQKDQGLLYYNLDGTLKIHFCNFYRFPRITNSHIFLKAYERLIDI